MHFPSSFHNFQLIIHKHLFNIFSLLECHQNKCFHPPSPTSLPLCTACLPTTLPNTCCCCRCCCGKVFFLAICLGFIKTTMKKKENIYKICLCCLRNWVTSEDVDAKLQVASCKRQDRRWKRATEMQMQMPREVGDEFFSILFSFYFYHFSRVFSACIEVNNK